MTLASSKRVPRRGKNRDELSLSFSLSRIGLLDRGTPERADDSRQTTRRGEKVKGKRRKKRKEINKDVETSTEDGGKGRLAGFQIFKSAACEPKSRRQEGGVAAGVFVWKPGVS